MSLIPAIRARDAIQALLKAGFRIVRSRGSHFRFEHPSTKRQVTVACHQSLRSFFGATAGALAFHPGDLSRKLIHSIRTQAGLTVQEFLRYLKGK